MSIVITWGALLLLFAEGAWTHDKFNEMEDDADNKPSSTTETK